MTTTQLYNKFQHSGFDGNSFMIPLIIWFVFSCKDDEMTLGEWLEKRIEKLDNIKV